MNEQSQTSSTRAKGKWGEEIAEQYLKDSGYMIKEKNYRSGKGEIDIIAEYEGVLVFIEVKSRSNLDYGGPEWAITPAKQKQIRKIAERYLFFKNIKDRECRFDVVTVLKLPEQPLKVELIKNAFW